MNLGNYEQLLGLSREISSLESVAKLLSWDEQTCMPECASTPRAEQRAVIAQELHRRQTSAEFGDLLAELDEGTRAGDLNDAATANIRELRRVYVREAKVPTKLAQALTRSSSEAFYAWREARSQDNFRQFEPRLAELLQLTRERIDAIGYECDPYDVLLEDYEPGLSLSHFVKIVTPLKVSLPSLVDKLRDQSTFERQQPDLPAAKAFEKLGRKVAVDFGFDLRSGRIDTADSSFCTGLNMFDVRLASNINSDNPVDSLYAIIHEVGHGLYHQGLPPEHRGTPLGRTNSLSLHESQARWWENFVGRSRPFCEHYLPFLQEFQNGGTQLTVERLYRQINQVRPSLIRVEADEVTYNLHVLLRVELEVDLIHGRLGVKDLPDVWNQKMSEYLGIVPKGTLQGVLQDIHWSRGMFGYFGTYLLGNVIAARWHEQLTGDIRDFDDLIRSGNYTPLLEWMRKHVHRHGSRFTAPELVRNVTGCDIDATPLLDHLVSKFTTINRSV